MLVGVDADVREEDDDEGWSPTGDGSGGRSKIEGSAGRSSSVLKNFDSNPVTVSWMARLMSLMLEM